mmetsp:Transcript_66257/g.130390  ORF Transcript_66257/g.130390 Transcript_66257/m.130390 type:complete len:295 (-) Transcript_66257:26-910(-)
MSSKDTKLMNGSDLLTSSSICAVQRKAANVPKTLNLDAKDQPLWLVKIPTFVAEKWATMNNDDVLGSMSISLKSAGPNKPPTKQLNVKLTQGPSDNGPDSFTLEELKSSSSMVALSADPAKGFSLDGKITKKMVLKPQINDEYRRLVRERALANVANRKEIGVANMKEIERTSTQSHTVEFISSDRMELKRKAAAEKGLQSNKMSRLGGSADESEVTTALRSRVFEAFEKSDRLTFKDILSFCSDVPGFTKEQDLRDLLEQYGQYNYRGTYKHFWELKQEFKDNYTEPEPKEEV